MLQYVFKRLLGALPTLLVIITLAFFLIRLAPGGPFDTERPIPPEIAANIERAYHLDQPLPVQYGYYLLNVLQGDFGPSFKYKDHSVSALIAEGFPVSLQLGVLAMLLALLIGLPAGILAALHQNRPLDHAVMAVAMTGITVPNFVMAPLLALVFGVFLHWLPVAGWDAGWKSAVLPVIALALPQVAYAARLMRASMLETLSSAHIRTAFAKGLPMRLILWRHVLKGALLPVLSWLGPATAAIITGSVVIEQIFGIPGIGRHFVQGALNRDYTLVMGVVVFYGALIILMNLLVDVIYGLMDPRVRYD
ncbi:MAG: oligopeptide ABC transporter permease OppB [Candidatus Thiothrix putei]|uniref:Oligopeptide ABC transporter permease OppB n=1 Tax=Candidatus Thiothrix putei TaxID=3080811 RepID=A0AA95HE98_9GAMM|nr:MAG: oligopeptide ABC transporter permease OppB [Candidatus Thiothrix putei]